MQQKQTNNAKQQLIQTHLIKVNKLRVFYYYFLYKHTIQILKSRQLQKNDMQYHTKK